MKRLTYMSKFTYRMSRTEVQEIGEVSARNNEIDGLTGVLICIGEVFFQVLEGDDAKVDEVFERICKDPRHTSIICLNEESDVEERQFINWNMKTIQLDSNIDTIIHKPIKTLFQTVVDQLQERNFLERILEESTKSTPHEVLKLGFEECLHQTGAEKGIIYSREEEETFHPLTFRNVRETRFSTGDDPMSNLLMEIAENQDVTTFLVVPVTHEGKTEAVIILGRNTPFTDQQRQIVNVVAGHLGLGYQNARKMHTMRKRVEELENQVEREKVSTENS